MESPSVRIAVIIRRNGKRAGACLQFPPPSGRLAGAERSNEVQALQSPSVRIVSGYGQGYRNNLGKPDVQRACNSHSSVARGRGSGPVDLSITDWGRPGGLGYPAVLVSYAYIRPFLRDRSRCLIRDWVLDSGAFSAHASGKPVVLQDYIDTAKQLLAKDRQLSEVFALDVIGNPEASIRNADEMTRQGVECIPCFHFGSPWDYLLDMASRFKKIALGGAVMVKESVRRKWYEQCFARVWPKKIHGFGVSGEQTSLMFPWHSVDASSWELGPAKYGNWRTYGNLPVRGSNHDLRVEIAWHLKLERRMRDKWRKEMNLLETLK